jgi:dihydroorotate dehydrogenase (NAD+) catalytic subunit
LAPIDLDLFSPWMNAAGMVGFAPPERWNWPEPAGAWVTNPLSLGPRTPAESRATMSFPGGALVHSGLPNPGLKAILHRYAERWAHSSLPAWVHIFGHSADEIHQMVLRLEEVEGVAAIELGIGDDLPAQVALAQIRAAQGELPLVVSLPFQRAGEDWLGDLIKLGASAITLRGPRGTLPAPEGGESRPISGRLYGPALLPQVMETMQFLRQRLRLPIIAGAGVYRVEDGQALLKAGAWGIQIDTVLWL